MRKTFNVKLDTFNVGLDTYFEVSNIKIYSGMMTLVLYTEASLTYDRAYEMINMFAKANNFEIKKLVHLESEENVYYFLIKLEED